MNDDDEHGTNTVSEDQVGNIYVVHKSTVPLVLTLLFIGLCLLVIYIAIGWLISVTQLASTYTFAVIAILLVLQIIAWVLFFYVILGWINEYYIIRPGTLIVRQGIFVVIEDNYKIARTQRLEVYQSFIGKIFNYGDLKLTGVHAVSIRQIPNPHHYEEILKKAVIAS